MIVFSFHDMLFLQHYFTALEKIIP